MGVHEAGMGGYASSFRFRQDALPLSSAISHKARPPVGTCQALLRLGHGCIPALLQRRRAPRTPSQEHGGLRIQESVAWEAIQSIGGGIKKGLDMSCTSKYTGVNQTDVQEAQ